MVWSVAKVEPVPVLTVTVEVPPSSAIDSGSTESTSAGAASLSPMVIATVPAMPTLLEPGLPDSVRVSSGSSMVSSVGVRVNVAVALVAPAPMVSTKSSTGTKSAPACAPDPPAPESTDSVTVVAPLGVLPVSVPVTVMTVAPSSSSTWLVFTDSVTVVAALSSSLTVSVTGAGARMPGSGLGSSSNSEVSKPVISPEMVMTASPSAIWLSCPKNLAEGVVATLEVAPALNSR